MTSIESLEKIVVDYFGKRPRIIVPYSFTDLVDWSKLFNGMDNGKQFSSNLDLPGGFPNASEVAFFGDLVFCGDNENSAIREKADVFKFYLKGGLVGSAKTTLFQNQRAIDNFEFRNVFFDSLYLEATPEMGITPGTDSTFCFIGYKIVF